MLSDSGVILGYSHFGMLAAARWVLQQTQDRLEEAMLECPTYHLQVVGHSLGAGTAALLTTRWASCRKAQGIQSVQVVATSQMRENALFMREGPVRQCFSCLTERS